MSTLQVPADDARAPEVRAGGGLILRTALASGLLMIVVGGVFVILFVAITNFRGSTQERRESREALVATEGLQKLVIDLETGLRGFVITGEERFLEPWRDARAAFPDRASALERLLADKPDQLERARRIRRAGRSYIRAYSVPLVDAVRRHDASARSVARTQEGKRRVDAIRAEFERLAASERGALAAREASADDAGRRAIVVGAAGLAGSILLISLFVGYLIRAIVRPVRRAAGMADRLAGGDLGARMPTTGVGEVGVLERSFNVMAGSLQASRDELTRLLEEQAALRRVATWVAQMVTPSDVFEAVTREVGLLFGADLVRMERYEPDGTVTGIAAWSRTDDRLAVRTRFALEGVSIAVRVRETGRPMRVDSFADASGPIAREARELGIRSSVGCPIVVGARLWGVIAASSRSEAPFPAGTESQIAEFTELVATAIANAEGRAELAASRARVVAAADLPVAASNAIYTTAPSSGSSRSHSGFALPHPRSRPSSTTSKRSSPRSEPSSKARSTICGRSHEASTHQSCPRGGSSSRSGRSPAARRFRSSSTCESKSVCPSGPRWPRTTSSRRR